MSASLPMEGLSTEQAPPLSIPAVFFLLVPAAMVAAGVLLVAEGPRLLWSRQTPGATAGSHLGTLGVLGAAMFGALYQMIPVVAGRPVPAARLAHAVQLGLVAGLAALLWGFLDAEMQAFRVAVWVLGGSVLVFLGPTAYALARAPARTETVHGMRIALAGLAAVLALGLGMAWGLATMKFEGDFQAWHAAHVAIGLVVWVGGLIASVSWQVLPMFYLAPPFPRWSRRLVLALVGLAFLLVLGALAGGRGAGEILGCALPGAVAIWLVHPAIAIHRLRARKRRRAGTSLWFWYAGLACGVLAFGAGIAAARLEDPRWPVLWGWLAIWGWAALIVHGMLTRIVPFLVWFHRFSALVGRVPVPPVRRLYPEGIAQLGLAAHLSAIALGCAALGTGWPPLARAAGAALAAAGLVLAWGLARALLYRAPAV